MIINWFACPQFPILFTKNWEGSTSTLLKTCIFCFSYICICIFNFQKMLISNIFPFKENGELVDFTVRELEKERSNQNSYMTSPNWQVRLNFSVIPNWMIFKTRKRLKTFFTVKILLLKPLKFTINIYEYKYRNL